MLWRRWVPSPAERQTRTERLALRALRAGPLTREARILAFLAPLAEFPVTGGASAVDLLAFLKVGRGNGKDRQGKQERQVRADIHRWAGKKHCGELSHGPPN